MISPVLAIVSDCLPDCPYINMFMLNQQGYGYFFEGRIQAEQGGYPERPVEQTGEKEYVTYYGNCNSQLYAPGVVAGKTTEFDKTDQCRQSEAQHDGIKINAFTFQYIRPQYPCTDCYRRIDNEIAPAIQV